MNWLQQKILELSIKHVFHGISKNDIILIRNNGDRDRATINGLEIPRDRMLKYKEEADYLSQSLLWRDICEKSIRYAAQEFGMRRKDGDLPLAQAMILNLDILKKAIKDIQNFNIGKAKK